MLLHQDKSRYGFAFANIQFDFSVNLRFLSACLVESQLYNAVNRAMIAPTVMGKPIPLANPYKATVSHSLISNLISPSICDFYLFRTLIDFKSPKC